MTLRNQKSLFEERFNQVWTSLSVQYHFKSIASSVCQLPFSEINLHLNRMLSANEIDTFSHIISELATKKPLQHILGETEFMDCRIFCTKDALIPRPETEELVDLICSHFKNTNQKINILDLCTGTGCIAIALQKKMPNTVVIGIDNFDSVISLARKNNIENATNVRFEKTDVLDPAAMKPFETKEFDIWVSNPPYIPYAEMVNMDDNVLLFEPEAALFVDDNEPLLFYSAIALRAMKGLRDGGWLFFEIHEDFGQETIDLLHILKYQNISMKKDMQGKNRMICAQKIENGQ